MELEQGNNRIHEEPVVAEQVLDGQVLTEESRAIHRDQEPGDFYLLGKGGSVEYLPKEVELLHVSFGLTRELAERLCDFPNLRVVRLPPWNYRKYYQLKRPATRILEERGIEVRKGRWKKHRSSTIDENTHPYRPYWQARRQFLLELDQGKREILERAKELKFDEVEWLEIYFRLDDDPEDLLLPKTTFEDFALSLGESKHVVRERIMGLLGCLGYLNLPDGKDVQRSINRFKRNFEQAHLLGKPWVKSEFEEFQTMPEGLPPSQWVPFWALTKIMHQSPKELESLSPRALRVLDLYFGLWCGKHHSLSKIGKMFEPPVTHQAVIDFKKRAFEQLGITKEKLLGGEPRIITWESVERCQHRLPRKVCHDCLEKKKKIRSKKARSENNRF